MLESLIGFLTTIIPTIFVGWSIPIVYICLCLISGYARRRCEAKIPDRIEPRPCVPSLHPVMLSALQFHGETASQNYSNTLCAALAGVVHLIGRGKVACTETVPPPEDEAPSPFVERRRRRARMTARDEVAHAFGADVLLARRDADDGDRCDARTLELFMPDDARTISVEGICQLPRTHDDLYRRIRTFLDPFEDELVAMGLLRRSGILTQVAFGSLTSVLAAASCILEPAAVLEDPDPAFVPFALVLMLAVMLCRALAVDRGPTLTPEGAGILSDGLATVAWGETLSRMGAEPLVDAPPMADVPDLLATLLAMGHPGLAADLAGRVELSLSQKETPPGSPRDTSRAKEAVLFCARRTRSVHGDVKMRTSPACRIFDDLERHCSSMSS